MVLGVTGVMGCGSAAGCGCAGGCGFAGIGSSLAGSAGTVSIAASGFTAGVGAGDCGWYSGVLGAGVAMGAT